MKTKFTVPEISCGHCKETIEAAINTIDSVENVSVNIAVSYTHLTLPTNVAV